VVSSPYWSGLRQDERTINVTPCASSTENDETVAGVPEVRRNAFFCRTSGARNVMAIRYLACSVLVFLLSICFAVAQTGAAESGSVDREIQSGDTALQQGKFAEASSTL
jgi:hypothetical protein